MRKREFIFISILFIICITLSISSISMSYSKKEDPSSLSNPNPNNQLNTFSFDVQDFSGKEINTIDIASLKYTNNTISTTNTDFKISNELTNEIYNLIHSYGASASFYIVSLDDGMTIGYNVDRKFETASSIKAPYALYLYHEVAKGNIDLNQKLVYKERYYNPGTGVVKRSPFGTEYTIKDLIYYSLYESDNIAYEILHGNFGVKGYNEMLRNLGTKELYLTASNPWGYTSCRSAALIWQDIYNFSITDSEGIELLNILSTGKYNYYKEVMPEIESASKTGFAKKDVVETGIVFDDHPYIAIAMANKGGNIGAYTEVIRLIKVMNKVMLEYNTYLNQK